MDLTADIVGKFIDKRREAKRRCIEGNQIKIKNNRDKKG